MIRNSLEFWFNGHSSKEFGIHNVNVNSGDSLLEETFLPNRNIIEERTRWNQTPYFNGVEEDCRKFSLSLAFKPEYCGGTQMMDKRALRNMALWLGGTNKYNEMWFIEDCEINTITKKRDITRPKRIYFVMLTGESSIHHYGRDMGYLTLEFKTNAPYCYSKIKGGDTYVLKSDRDDNLDMSEEGANSFVFFFNYGDKPIKPQISLVNLVANQHIKIIGQPVPPEYGKQELREFDYTYPMSQTDFNKFPIFEISEGKKAKGSFKLNDTVYDGETVTIGEKTYEFDLGDNQPKNKIDKNNILVPILGGKKAHNTLNFKDGFITDGDTVTIGDQCFEYDFNDIVTPTNIKVDISEYVGRASGIMNLETNLLPNQEFKVGDVDYTMIGGTNEFIIKMTDHLLTNGDDVNVSMKTNRKTLTQDSININTKIPKNIDKCLVRNISKNPSDLGIRKMKYLDKDFVMVLWNGESNEDFHEKIDDVGINSRIVINFDEGISEDSINNNTIIVKDIEGNKIPILFDVENTKPIKSVGITPIAPYKHNTDYIIYVSRGVKNDKGEGLKYAKKIKFSTTSNGESQISEDPFVKLRETKNFNRNGLKPNELPKKITGMMARDDIWLYEESELDCIVDQNMLIPMEVPKGAKVYAGKTDTINNNGTPDDFINATKILAPLGYEIVDIAGMTLQEKKETSFNDGDLVVGGELAGTLIYDFDAQGNLKSTPPQIDNPEDIRKERIAGIPRDVYIKPAKRLCGSASNPGREGTKKAMEDWAELISQAKGDIAKLPEGYFTNINLKGVSVKYKVPNDAQIYGTGTDFYNGLRYLGDMGYKFLNVGEMTVEDKLNLPYKKGDLVLGGTGAVDVVLENGEKKTVQGIPMIDIRESIRLGGRDRYETEKKIKDYASSLKVKGIDIGDILKLEIRIGNEGNEKIDKGTVSDGDTPALSSTNEKIIKDDVKIEFHRVKNIKELSRNRLYIEFEEDIRTIHYTNSIEILNVYKFYEDRKAEDYLFTAPYQIKIGYGKDETILNIIKAMNSTGIAGIEYSLRTFKHPIVIAQKKNEDEILLTAIEYGSRGNIPISLIDVFNYNNRFLTPTLTGGKDCTQDKAVIALAGEIERQNKLPERYDKDRYECEYTENSLKINHILKGKKFNNIICLANVTEQQTMPYFVEGNSNLIKLKDFLTYSKSLAKWENPTLIEGEDPDTSECILPLKAKIEEYQNNEINVRLNELEDGIVDTTKLNLEYKIIGEIGNINFDTTCMYGIISGKKFMGGLDGLEEGEELFIDCEKEEIISNLGKDRHKNFNGNWLQVPMDDLKWKIKDGECVVSFRYRETYYI